MLSPNSVTQGNATFSHQLRRRLYGKYTICLLYLFYYNFLVIRSYKYFFIIQMSRYIYIYCFNIFRSNRTIKTFHLSLKNELCYEYCFKTIFLLFFFSLPCFILQSIILTQNFGTSQLTVSFLVSHVLVIIILHRNLQFHMKLFKFVWVI